MESGKENCASKSSQAKSPASGYYPHHGVLGEQHALMPPYGTPVFYPAIYPSNGVFAHTTVSPGKCNDQSYKRTSVEKKGNFGSGNDAVSIRFLFSKFKKIKIINKKRSGEIGTDGSSNGSEDNSTTAKNGKFNVNAKSHNSRSINQHWKHGANTDKGMDLWSTPGTEMGTDTFRSKSNVSHYVTPDVWLQDERELKKEKRKQSNRESARRSRLRKQAECEGLQARVHDLGRENDQLRDELKRLSVECANLRAENGSIKEDLTRVHGPNALTNLELGNGLVEEK